MYLRGNEVHYNRYTARLECRALPAVKICRCPVEEGTPGLLRSNAISPPLFHRSMHLLLIGEGNSRDVSTVLRRYVVTKIVIPYLRCHAARVKYRELQRKSTIHVIALLKKILSSCKRGPNLNRSLALLAFLFIGKKYNLNQSKRKHLDNLATEEVRGIDHL